MMTTGRLALGAFLSCLASLAVFVAVTALLAWLYHTFYLSNPEVQFDPSRFAWVKRFCLGLAWFVPPILFWWLAVFLAGRHRIVAERPAPAHRLFARADLWLLASGLLWGLLNYAAATRLLPTELFACGGNGFFATCVGPRRSLYWGITGLAAACFLLGLVLRIRHVGRTTGEATHQVPPRRVSPGA